MKISKPDEENLRKLLIEEKNFSEQRVENTLQKLNVIFPPN